MLPLLRELSFFLNRCYALVKNLVQQLASLYNERERLYVSSFKHIHLMRVWEGLGRFFAMIITLDEMLAKNQAFAAAWASFKRMLRSVRLDPARYGTDDDALRKLEKVLLSLEGDLLDGLVFQNCVEQEFDVPNVVSVRNNGTFRAELANCLRIYFDSWSEQFADVHETDQRLEFVGILGLYVLYFTLFRDDKDKKFFKTLTDMHRRLPLVHLYGTTVWEPADFLAKKLPTMAKLIASQDLQGTRREISRQTDAQLPRDVKYLQMEVCTWMVRMESNLAPNTDIRDVLTTRVSLAISGVTLAHQVGNVLKTALHLHLVLDEPMKKGLVSCLCQLAELLKAIEGTYQRKAAQIAESIMHMIKQISFSIQKVLLPVQARLRQTKKFDDAKLDSMAAIALLSNLLCGSTTPDRLLLVTLAFNIANSKGIFKDEEVDEIRRHLWKLKIVASLGPMVRRACDTSFLYWSRELIPLFLGDIYANPIEAHRLQYVVSFLRDPAPVVCSAVHEKDGGESFWEQYREDVFRHLKKIVIEPLCRDIETDLRLHIHSAVHRSDTPATNPLKNPLKDLGRFLAIRPLRFFDRSIDLRAHVAHYLESTFYNLTTVALHDWKTYGEMRNLAAKKYGLVLTESHLPSQTLEQGLDVLEIMRNIHIFVAKYNYNLNAQIFIERSAELPHLNTISIRHIANSIRTHGTGIMNTTVNFAYQFLLNKFKVFSQFLYDDHIKSPLIKDAHFYRDNKEKLDNIYPYERAEKFNKDIKKLGVNAKGLSYLDQFRELVTTIGNTLGYVRMVRSGGLLYLANAIKFVPDLKNITPFAPLVEKAALPKETVEAARNLDSIVENLSSKFSQGTDYFAVLVEIFTQEMKSDALKHLRNFYVIVPALIINWIEHIVGLKDKMKGTKKKEMGFCDDGFALGLSYLLKVLDQGAKFDSLHWFQSMNAQYAVEEKKLKKVVEESNAVKARNRDNDLQTIQLTQRRLESLMGESELLFYTFSSCRILFKE
jgi:WASH complex subunit 7